TVEYLQSNAIDGEQMSALPSKMRRGQAPSRSDGKPLPRPMSTGELVLELSNRGGMQEPVCAGPAPHDRSQYPNAAAADWFIGQSLQLVCQSRDPGPSCRCQMNPDSHRFEVDCVMVSRYSPDLDALWHGAGVTQICRTTGCHCRQPGEEPFLTPVPEGSAMA
ncbi:MAG: hypothetical protein M1830_009807, partial [Pleopsidium flavum]